MDVDLKRTDDLFFNIIALNAINLPNQPTYTMTKILFFGEGGILNQNLTHIELDIKKPTLLHGFVEGVKTFQDKLNLGHVFKYQNNRLST